MKKIFIYIVLIFLLTACDSKKEETDLTSGPTSKYDKSNVGTTKADEQFAKLKKNGNGEKQIIKTVRPEVARFVEEQFKEENVQDKTLADLRYKVNNMAISTSFDDDAKYMIRNVGFDYEINVKKLEKEYSVDQFIETMKKEDGSFKLVEMKAYDKVLVKNLNDDSFASSLVTVYSENGKSYELKFTSKKMSIAEIIMLSEKFSEFLNK